MVVAVPRDSRPSERLKTQCQSPEGEQSAFMVGGEQPRGDHVEAEPGSSITPTAWECASAEAGRAASNTAASPVMSR